MSHLRDLLREPTGAKEENRLNLLRAIMAKPGNQSYLSKRSGLSAAAVSDAVKDLSRAGVILAQRDGQAVFVEMAPTTGAAVGIELGYQHTAIVTRRVEQSYNRAVVKVRQTGAAGGSSSWLDDVVQSINTAVAELGEQDVATIGVGIPRMVDPRDGTLTPPLLPPWENGEDPAKKLQEKLNSRYPDLTVLLDNDANLAALAESTYTFPEADTLVSIKVSTGVGAGIIISGQVYRGRRGVAGEIGHTVVEPGGRFCSCGGRGCLETLIGADALVEQARTVLGHIQQNWPSSLDDLMASANQGNAVCQRVIREAAARLGQALGNLCNLLNPQVVVIGGAFGRLNAEDLVLGPCRVAIQQSAMRAAYEADFDVVRSQLPHAAAHGALVLGLRGTTY
ncbi:MAG TPA: ROK family transcriptional regulator [Streptosporangiaceae bacterium]|nr:ROK family transcriptional regulator [Streptosporangiaceae bacterium]